MVYILKNEVTGRQSTFDIWRKDQLVLQLLNELAGLPKVVTYRLNENEDVVISVVAYAYQDEALNYQIAKP